MGEAGNQTCDPWSAILKEGIIGNIHVKLFETWTSGSGGDAFREKILTTDERTMDGCTTDKDQSQ